MGRVDAPLLNDGSFKFYDQPIFDTPRVPQFIRRTKIFDFPSGVKVKFRSAWVFDEAGICASFRSSISPAKFHLLFPCSEFPAQVTIMERICAQWPPLVSHVEFLELFDDVFEDSNWQWWEGITPWLGFLRQFTAVQTLRLHVMEKVPHVTHVLGAVEGARVTKVLPTLRTIELACPVCPEQGARSETLRVLRPFLVAREELERPVVVNPSYKS